MGKVVDFLKGKKQIVTKHELEGKYHLIPADKGLITLWGEKELLFVQKTNNMYEFVTNLFARTKHDNHIKELIDNTDTILVEKFPSIIETLIKEKMLIADNQPQYNQSTVMEKPFVYLAVDFFEIPYLRVCETTSENYFYIGPFRDRFFLYDLMYNMGDLFKLPVCIDEKHPQQRYREDKCEGYCLIDIPERTEVIIDNYLLRNEKLLARLDEEYQKRFRDLRFMEAEVIKKQLRNLRKFYQYITFCHVVKKINTSITYEDIHLDIQSGMISSVRKNNLERKLHIPIIEYRENEVMAIDKKMFPECWEVFRLMENKAPEQIEKLYLESGRELRDKLLGS